MLEEDTPVGVPEMAPLVLLNVSPVGSVGEIDQEVTVPPVEDGDTVDIAEPFVSVSELGL